MQANSMQSKVRSEHQIHCDILVAGGGIAGVCAALAAARCGSKVIMLQDRPVLGGNASSEVRMHICGADMSGGRGIELACETREGGIVEEIRLSNAALNPQRSFPVSDLLLYDMVRRQENLTVLLNTTLIAAQVEDGRIVAVRALRESTEDAFTISAEVFIDATGDGRLGAEAGARYRRGREGRNVHGETLAKEHSDHLQLGSSLLFQADDKGHRVPFKPFSWSRTFDEAHLKHRPHRSYEYGYWWIEWGGKMDTIADNEYIRDELLAILSGVWDHIKNTPHDGADSYALRWVGFVPGKRESRRFIGQYTFTEHDATTPPHHEDTIAYGGWSLDTHPPGGIDAVEEKPSSHPTAPYLYGIPLRCCVSTDIANLMFAGRNISASHQGFATLRVMATCGLIGQGVGTAAALALRHNVPVQQAGTHPEFMRIVQRQLQRDDCFLAGASVEDSEDMATSAEVSASSEQAEGPAANVLTVHTRSTHGELGTHPRYQMAGTNRWMSCEGLPAYIELVWPRAIDIAEVRLVFDTGQHRPLTLTGSDSFCETMVWAAQPETVRDYSIQARVDGQWQAIVDVRDNFLRLRTHRFRPVQTDAIRITVTATNGLDHARICGIRCYARLDHAACQHGWFTPREGSLYRSGYTSTRGTALQ